MESLKILIEEEIKNFLGAERWDVVIKDKPTSEDVKQELSPEYLDLLLHKYRCKFPQGIEEEERVRL